MRRLNAWAAQRQLSQPNHQWCYASTVPINNIQFISYLLIIYILNNMWTVLEKIL